MNHLIVCIVTIICLLLAQPLSDRSPFHPASSSAEPPCASGSFTVEDQLGAPVRLTVAQTLCDGPKWKARLVLANTADKVISGYDIANVETYDHKKNVRSSQGENGFTLKPGESKEIISTGGFRDGRSCGKPTGSIRKNAFRVARIEFADGSLWQQKTNP